MRGIVDSGVGGAETNTEPCRQMYIRKDLIQTPVEQGTDFPTIGSGNRESDIQNGDTIGATVLENLMPVRSQLEKIFWV